MIRLDLPNIITIGLCGAAGYALLVGGKKLWSLFNGTGQ